MTNTPFVRLQNLDADEFAECVYQKVLSQLQQQAQVLAAATKVPTASWKKKTMLYTAARSLLLWCQNGTGDPDEARFNTETLLAALYGTTNTTEVGQTFSCFGNARPLHAPKEPWEVVLAAAHARFSLLDEEKITIGKNQFAALAGIPIEEASELLAEHFARCPNRTWIQPNAFDPSKVKGLLKAYGVQGLI